MLISIKEAKKRGLKRYFTGIPCKNGHISERQVSDRSCCQCKKEKGREYQKTEKYKNWKNNI